jgi:hypothetical protein
MDHNHTIRVREEKLNAVNTMTAPIHLSWYRYFLISTAANTMKNAIDDADYIID